MKRRSLLYTAILSGSVLVLSHCTEFSPTEMMAPEALSVRLEAVSWPDTVRLAEAVPLAVRVVDGAGRTVTSVGLSWTVSEPSRVVVSEASGSPMAVGASLGGAVVRVQLADSAFRATPLEDSVHVALAGVRLDRDTVELKALQDTAWLSVRGLMFDGTAVPTSGFMWWTTGDGAVGGIVDRGGDRVGAVAVAGGTDLVVVEHGLCTGSCRDTVVVRVAQEPVAVHVEPERTEMVSSGTQWLGARVEDRNGYVVPDVSPTWRSSDTLVVAVDWAGRARARLMGKATVAAALSDGLEGSVDITVVAGAPATVEAAPDTLLFTALADTVRIAATVLDAHGNVVETPALTWTVLNPGPVEVDSGGVVRALGSGWSAVEVRVGSGVEGPVDTVHAGVAQEAVTMTLSPDSVAALQRDTVAFSASALDANGFALETGPEWSSTDPAVAAVDGTGRVVALAPGRAWIRASWPGAVDSAAVTVNEAGTLVVELADAPADELATAVVHLSGVSAGAFDGSVRWPISGGAQSLDLLTLQGGVTAELGRARVRSELLEGVFLNVDSVVVTLAGGQTFTDGTASRTHVPTLPLSAELARSAPAGDTLRVVVDFDVNRSFSLDGTAASGYTGVSFVPSLRAADRAEAAIVTGRVTTTGTASVAGLVVEAARTDTPGDTATAITDSVGTYTLRYLVPGDYSLSLVGSLPACHSAGASVLLGGVSATVAAGDLTVEPAPVTTVVVSPTADTLTALDAGTTLTATVLDTAGSVLAGASVEWETLDPAVATVSTGGVVTATGAGTARILASSCEVSDTVTVRVDQRVAGLAVSPADTVVAPGDTITLAVAAEDANGHPIAGVAVDWASSDTSVATVDPTGVVVAVAAGTATLEAVDPGTGTTATAAVRVETVPVTSYAQRILADGPMAYWRLEESSGTTAADASGFGRDGTHVGSVGLGVPGLLATEEGGAASFNATDDDGVRVAPAAWMDVAELTVEAWFQLAAVPADTGVIVGKGWSHDLSVRDGQVVWNIMGATGGEIMAPTPLFSDSVYHVVSVLAGGNAYLYLNGALVASDESGTLALEATPYELHIGRGLSTLRFNFAGVIDEVALYDRGLTAAEVAAHHEAGAGAASAERVPPSPELSISMGHHHSCAVLGSGEAYCWGWNGLGQLGIGTLDGNPHPTPEAVSPGTVFSRLDGGSYSHTCGLTPGGEVYCWGDNPNGELGDGTFTASYSPTRVAGGHAFASMGAGHATCGVTTSNETYCWGRNDEGQIGYGILANQPSPVPVATGLVLDTVFAGTATCGLTPAGEAYCWGAGAEGQLGDGTTPSYRLEPGLVSGGHTFQQLTGHWYQVCGLTAAGEAYCWGGGYGTTPVLVSGGLELQAVEAGAYFECGLTTAGAAYCWGSNGFGQLGNGTYADSATPVAVSGGHVFRQVDAGADHACGVTTADEIWCWGRNAEGQLGDGTTTQSNVPVRVEWGGPSGPVMTTLVVEPDTASLAVGDSVLLMPMPYDADGNLILEGVGVTWTSLDTAVAAVDNGGTVLALAEGTTGVVAITAEGIADTAVIAVHTASPTGAFTADSLALYTPVRGEAGTWAVSSSGVLEGAGLADQSLLLRDGVTFADGWVEAESIGVDDGGLVMRAQSEDDFYVLALRDDGNAYQSGTRNLEFFRCALGVCTDYLWRADVEWPRGSAHTTRLEAAGDTFRVYFQGALVGTVVDSAYRGPGGVGMRHNAAATYPDWVSHYAAFRWEDRDPAGTWQSVASAHHNTCALDSGGAAYCWGWSEGGRLGNGDASGAAVTTPTPVLGGLTFVQISSAPSDAEGHGCGLTADGQAYCWGSNLYGQLGDGTNTSSATPVAVTGGHTFQAVSANYWSSCGLTTGGEVFCWGRNSWGTLGDSTFTDRAAPVPVHGGHTFRSITDHSSGAMCGITTADALYCWGANSGGWVGDGTTTNRATPTLVAGGHLFATVSGGWQGTCGVTVGGQTYCWGKDYGTTPVQIASPTELTSVGVGAGHYCGLGVDQQAYCWGYDSWGGLGNGAGGNDWTPTPVLGGHAFDQVSVGSNAICARAVEGDLYCWGRNAYGELGDGTLTRRDEPVKVVWPTP